MAIVIYARKSVERENSISCETQLEYCRAMIKPDERSDEVITIVDNGFSGGPVFVSDEEFKEKAVVGIVSRLAGTHTLIVPVSQIHNLIKEFEENGKQ